MTINIIAAAASSDSQPMVSSFSLIKPILRFVRDRVRDHGEGFNNVRSDANARFNIGVAEYRAGDPSGNGARGSG
jgi:hypothetical protein